MAKIHDVLTGQALGSVVNIFTLTAMSCALVAAIILAVWNILDDRVDIAVPDDALAFIKHDPNPLMMAWRPRIPDAVGTSTFTSNSTFMCTMTTTADAATMCPSSPMTITVSEPSSGPSSCVTPDGSTAYTCRR